MLGDKLGAGIEADGFLERIRIAYAANFSLNAKTDHGHFDFDPVLFSRHVGETSDGDLVDEHEASLLTPQDTVHFQRRFRSEEHTSELQSLMRISYAVFCLKKKK